MNDHDRQNATGWIPPFILGKLQLGKREGSMPHRVGTDEENHQIALIDRTENFELEFRAGLETLAIEKDLMPELDQGNVDLFGSVSLLGSVGKKNVHLGSGAAIVIGPIAFRDRWCAEAPRSAGSFSRAQRRAASTFAGTDARFLVADAVSPAMI